MRFALKVVPLGVLGCATALLVACGNGNGLLSGSQAGSLQAALTTVQSDCSGGRAARAAVAAQRFADRVNALPPGTVDRGLIANLQQGAATLEQLVSQTCTGTTSTTTTPTTTTTTPTTTTTTTPTTTTTTQPTTPTVPTTPSTTPTTPTAPPDNGGGTPGTGTAPGNSGGAPGNGGGAAPGQLKRAGETP